MGKNAKEDNLYKGSNMSKIEKGMTLQSRTQKANILNINHSNNNYIKYKYSSTTKCCYTATVLQFDLYGLSMVK